MVWPGIEPVQKSTCLDLNLLYSAAQQPYQNVYGTELYPTLASKAAYLFIHIATGHIFSNGNKRTAALCLDTFALLNSLFLILSNDEIRELAVSVASYREQGRQFDEVLQTTTKLLEKNLLPMRMIRKINMKAYRNIQRRKLILRRHPLNRINHPFRQRR